MVDYFHLPISFIENKKTIEKHFISDLELQETPQSKSLYEYVFNPGTNQFAKNTIQLWSQYYTSDKRFLKDSQKLLKKKIPTVENDYVNVNNVWKEIKVETGFEDKYFYIDWDYLKKLNTNSTFLQCMSIYNMSSPILSLALPIFFLIFPFILLNLQGIPLTMTKYIEVLKVVFQKHQFGQLFQINSATWEKRVYIIISLGFYLFQIYQNIMSCIRFYKNISKIHEQLFTMRDYIDETIKRMNEMEVCCSHLKTYSPFINHMKERKDVLMEMHKEIECISEYKMSFKKITEIGHIMKSFYKLYKDDDYKEALQYSFGFNGYIHNINQMKKSVQEGHMSAFKIIKGSNYKSKKKNNKPMFKNAYFPSLVGKMPVKNTYNLKRPMLITGPNAAGKTTMLKTTIFNLLCSQQTGFGFYEFARFTPFDYIHCYINIPDTSGRDSLFQSEARRCKDIITVMKESGEKSTHFCVFDELYSGTNPYEAIASATAFLRYLNKYTNSTYIITTHFLDICNRMENDKTISNMHMKIDMDGEDFIYTYQLEKGISNIKGGVKVLRDLEYPEYIINETKQMINEIVV
jgi:hypothetical protein